MYFVFNSESDDCKMVPAHKSHLSASSVFDAMFYGPAKETGNINIVDSSPEAFIEFLQFFYLNTVKLTTENVAEVMNLCKKYELDDCFHVCTEFFESSVTLDNICWGLELAILFEQKKLKKFCVQKIKENPKEIFQSNSFLICQPNLLRHILQIDSLKCDDVFDGCMAWAKASCIQKGLDENDMQMVRAELGNLFYGIPFDKFTHENFHDRYRSYEGLFSPNEFVDITMKITNKHFQSTKFNRNFRPLRKNHASSDTLVCNRIESNKIENFFGKANSYGKREDKTIFTLNRLLLLQRFHCSQVFCIALTESSAYDAKYTSTCPITITLFERCIEQGTTSVVYVDQSALSDRDKTVIEFPEPIVVKPGFEYEIRLGIEAYRCENYLSHKPEVQLDKDTTIQFLYEEVNSGEVQKGGIVTQLDFIHCTE